jgi:hypothetical protein
VIFWRRPAALVLLLVPLLLAGCGTRVTVAGGGGPATPGQPATPTGDARVPAPPARPSSLSGFQVVSVSAVAGVTYALGTAACAGAPCTAVARSTDGGRSWRPVAAPAAYVPGPGLLTSRLPVPDDVHWLRFGTARDGWAYGGALWGTHDGGAHWAHVDLGGAEVLDLAATGGRAYALVADCGIENGAQCADPRLLAAPVGTDDFADAAGLSPGRVEPGRVSAADGMAVVGSGPDVLVSTGAGWRRSSPCGRSGAATVTTAGRTAMAVCLDAALGGALFPMVLRSADGVRWSAAAGEPPRISAGVLAVAAGSPTAIALAWTGNRADGGLLASRDGGRTWTNGGPAGSTGSWVELTATGPAGLVALPAPPTPYYWSSTDGGRRWSPVRVG